MGWSATKDCTGRDLDTEKNLKIRTPEKNAVIILKFEQCGFTTN